MIHEVDSAQLDAWLPDPAIRVTHRRASSAAPDRLWDATRAVRLSDTRLLGRLIGWRIPGVRAAMTFDALFRAQPFVVVGEEELALVSGLVGRIWTLRRDYPDLSEPEEFAAWSTPGTAKVVFANWVDADSDEGAVLRSETRVQAFGVQGQVGLTSVRPLIGAFNHLVFSDAMAVAVRRAEANPAK
jgi:hypothetical protein